MGGQRWTQIEIESLIAMYKTHSVDELALEFNRAKSSIYYKIRELLASGDLQ